MKRLVFLLGLLALAAVLMAGAPANNSRRVTVASATVDSQWTGNWQLIDTLIIVKTDSCETYYHFTATAILKPGQTLYYGFRDGTALLTPNDTHSVSVPFSATSPDTFQIGSSYIDSLLSPTDANDTLKVLMACRGTGVGERRVAVSSVIMTATVFPRNI